MTIGICRFCNNLRADLSYNDDYLICDPCAIIMYEEIQMNIEQDRIKEQDIQEFDLIEE